MLHVFQAAYLFGFLMVLRNEETMKIRFESIDAVPHERVSFWTADIDSGRTICYLTLFFSIGEYFDVKLGTRKQAQTGVLHTWRLWANDADRKICPK